MTESDSPDTPEEETKLTFGERLLYGFWGFMFELFLATAIDRKEGTKILFALLLLVVCLAILASTMVGQVLTLFEPSVSDQVAEQVSDMEVSIKGLRDAESLLSKMKGDIERTDLARRQIEQDLAAAETLKDITDEQLEAMAAVVKRQSWWEWWKATLTGVFTGIASTITVGVGVRVWKMRYDS